eukprot:1157168-Pelagomonas_calceolata.AAC.6
MEVMNTTFCEIGPDLELLAILGFESRRVIWALRNKTGKEHIHRYSCPPLVESLPSGGSTMLASGRLSCVLGSCQPSRFRVHAPLHQPIPSTQDLKLDLSEQLYHFILCWGCLECWPESKQNPRQNGILRTSPPGLPDLR